MSQKENRYLIISSAQEFIPPLKEAFHSLQTVKNTVIGPKVPDYVVDYVSDWSAADAALESNLKANLSLTAVVLDLASVEINEAITRVQKILKQMSNTQILLFGDESPTHFESAVAAIGLNDRLLFQKRPFSRVELSQVLLVAAAKWNLLRLNNFEELRNVIMQQKSEIEAERSNQINNAKLISLGEMAGGIAHEINNPLAIIQTSTGVLKDLLADVKDESVKVFLEKIENTTVRIAKIIKGLRVISRDANDDPFENVPMLTIIQETLQLCYEKFKANGVDMVVSDRSGFSEIACNRVQIMQVFLNLLNNSYDSIIALPSKWVKAEIFERDGEVVVLFKDSGAGIPIKSRERLFQPFFTTKEVGKGTGLGLSVSRAILERHNGSLNVDFECENTCFVLKIPRVDTEK